ncbi:ribose-phosphate diphosphokinase [Candidatus Pacearchaeota archaeon]|nr:ribose-phosphate diphosphokinase [Candidatus Pacearchaeota archaeon]
MKMEKAPILILADPNGNAWDFAHKVYQKLNSNPDRERRYSLGKVEITKFNDGEIFIKISENVRKKTCFFIHDSSMPPQDWLVSLAQVNDALRRSSAGKINNVLPYMKYSRQDRMADPRTPISAGIVAEIINRSAFRVITTDLHNPSTTTAYKIPFDNLKAYPVIIDHLKEHHPGLLQDAVVVAPDAGSAKRAESYLKRLDLDIAIAHKKREKAGVIKKMTIIGNVEGKNCIIVDDMIDTGGTLCKAAEILKENGAKSIIACATHGVLSNNAVERLENSCFDKILITDTIPRKVDGKFEVISLASLFAEAIYRISHGCSVSELFQ